MASVHLVTTAGPGEGRGHLSRAIAIAEALREADAAVSAQLLRGAPSPLQAQRLVELGVRIGSAGENAIVLVDLPDPSEVAGRWRPGRLAVLDDRELFRGPLAVVIQPSLATWSGSAQPGRVLEGYAYAPIRSSLRRLAIDAPPEATPGRIVVCFGGSDPADVSARLAPAIAGASRWSTLTVVGPDYRGRLAEIHPGDGIPGPDNDRSGAPAGVQVVRDPTDLDRLLATASLVVCGAGTMKFELGLLGRPMIMLAVADDQRPVGPAFAATGAARYLGDGRTIDPATVAAEVATLVADGPARAAMASRGPTVVDGRGA
ncbi:MAG TPA: hypothetical protein VGQ85_02565, partial [Candidatus Limnocylindrales bacterium]|nr:hypothetical protein [Candidatus Limnocylindrales bacterium]